MTLSFGRVFKDIAVYGFGDLLLKAAAFITVPIYTHLFTPEDYGIWSFIATITSLLSGILILGGDSAYARFFFAAQTLAEKQRVTSSWFAFLALWSTAVTLLCLPFMGRFSGWAFGTERYGALFLLSLLAGPLVLLNTMCSQILRNEFRARLFTLLNLVSTMLSISLSLVGAVGFGLGLAGVLSGTLVAAGLMLPVRLWTARRMLRWQVSPPLLRAMLRFGLPLVPTSLAYWVFASSDRIVLGKLSTLDQLGLYSVANSLTSVLGVVYGALGQAWSPYAIRLYEDQPEVAPQFFGQILTYILLGFGGCCVAVTAFAPELLVLLSKPAFYPAALAVGPLALGFMAYASTQVTAIGLTLTKQTRYFAAFSGAAALLNLALNVALVPLWGMLASSWATAISYIFLTLAYLAVAQRLWPVIYETRRVVITGVATLGFTIAAPFLPDLHWLATLGLKIAYCLAYGGLLFLLKVIDPRIGQALWATAQRMWTGSVRGTG